MKISKVSASVTAFWNSHEKFCKMTEKTGYAKNKRNHLGNNITKISKNTEVESLRIKDNCCHLISDNKQKLIKALQFIIMVIILKNTERT